MKRALPNLLTVLRIVLSLALLFCRAFSPVFFVFYTLCGLSDWLDGYLARRLKAETALGALLDSLSDAVFAAVVLSRVLPVLVLPLWALICIAGIALMRIASLVVSFRRFQQTAFLHTYLNKLTGLVLFVCVPLLGYVSHTPLLAACCAVSVLSSLEELLLSCTMPAFDANVKGLFFMRSH